MQAFAAATHLGLKRRKNEDSYEADPELGLWLVADGVGGHRCGEVASGIVVATVRQGVQAGLELVETLRRSHQEILREIHQRGPSNDMGSTVVALQLQGNDYTLAWVGDSRAYLWTGSKLRLLTQDHNPVGKLLAQGAITPEQAAIHPDRHVLTQSLGVSEKIQLSPDQLQGSLEPGQQLLLCSDGLNDELTASEIASHLASSTDAQVQADALIEAALQAGGRDNVTVIVVGGSGTVGSRQWGPQPGEPVAEIAGKSAGQSSRQSSGESSGDASGWSRLLPWPWVLGVSALLLLAVFLL